jgi:hypothetical protein
VPERFLSDVSAASRLPEAFPYPGAFSPRASASVAAFAVAEEEALAFVPQEEACAVAVEGARPAEAPAAAQEAHSASARDGWSRADCLVAPQADGLAQHDWVPDDCSAVPRLDGLVRAD